jgi:hypothetical protein
MHRLTPRRHHNNFQELFAVTAEATRQRVWPSAASALATTRFESVWSYHPSAGGGRLR